MLDKLGCQRALLLQGPMGPFFRRLATELATHGVSVKKVNFNPGDALFFGGPDAIAYRGTLEDWPDRLRALIRELGVDAIFLFGDNRPIHRAALAVARELGVAVWVFEEGYLRPGYITIEKGGVNACSPLPKDPEAYRRAAIEPCPPRPQARRTFRWGGFYAALYAMALTLFGFSYPHYRHHRPLNAWGESLRWTRAGLRKVWFALRERRELRVLAAALSGRYFLVCLQVHSDAQVQSSDFASVEAFLEHVVRSFAEHGRATDSLVVKHHPMDRAYREYGSLVAELRQRYGLRDRLHYVHDLHLPTLLRHARGAVMINSTVGMSALAHGAPVKALGPAVYDLPGLTHQGSLESFWASPTPVDMELLRAFRGWLLRYNQASGSFYARAPRAPGATGIHWCEGRTADEARTNAS
jgi:capsule polysaccharide modification protein KpsS